VQRHAPREQILTHVAQRGNLGPAGRARIEMRLDELPLGVVALLVHKPDQSFSLVTHAGTFLDKARSSNFEVRTSKFLSTALPGRTSQARFLCLTPLQTPAEDREHLIEPCFYRT